MVLLTYILVIIISPPPHFVNPNRAYYPEKGRGMRVPKQNRGPYILAAGAAAQLLTRIPAAWGVFPPAVMQGYGV